MDERYKINVTVGIFVKIELQDEKEKFVTGKIKEVLSTNYFESSGILVILEDGSEGRVKEILKENSSGFELSPYDSIKLLEQKFRELIVNILSVEDRWWNTRIPGSVYKSVKEKMERYEESKKYVNMPKRDMIEQIDFAHIREIIRQSNNWNEFFKKVFDDKEIFESKLKELERIRNDVMHSKDITSDDKEKIKIYFNDLVYCMDNS
jgi:uncharacterized protein YwbE